MIDQHKLVKDCLKGKREAHHQLYEQFAGVMLGICYRYTKSVADAEDVLQEGFIKVFTHLSQYKAEGELGGLDQENYGEYGNQLPQKTQPIPGRTGIF